MPEGRLITVIFGLAGGGVGALLARFSGVESWLDAKLYIVGGIAVGALASALLERFSKSKSLAKPERPVKSG